jgi:hypothetical protein
VAPLAVHVRTTAVLLDSHFALGALTDVANAEEPPEAHLVIILALAFMEWLLA